MDRSYLAFNSPTISDSQAEANVEALATSLYSVIVTLVRHHAWSKYQALIHAVCREIGSGPDHPRTSKHRRFHGSQTGL